MNKINFWAIFSMLIALFIYLFYRTEATVINSIFIQVFSSESYFLCKRAITGLINLPSLVIFSLPEGLWVFSTTLLSSYHIIRYKNISFKLIYLPLVIAIMLEFFQLANISNGYFDVFDLLFSIIFWSLGYLVIHYTSIQKEFQQKNSFQFKICCLTYISIYLAHVWN